MAKDDYEVVAYKILVYLYAVMKGKTVFEDLVFRKAVLKDNISDEYLARILHLMIDEELITGVSVIKTWGSNYIIASDLCEAEITAAGIRYLKSNHEVRDAILSAAESIATLIIQLKLAPI